MNFLNRKYIKLLNFKNMQEEDGKIKFECPYSDCKQDGKTKAYVLSIDSLTATFYCHRCNKKHHWSKLLEEFDYILYRKYLEEKRFYEIDNFTIKEPTSIKITNEKTYEHDFDDFRKHLKSLDNLSSYNKGKQYIEIERRIPKKHHENMFYFKGNPYEFFNKIFNTEKYSKQAEKGYTYEGVIVPFLTKQNNITKIVGFALRVIGNSRMRFINLFNENIGSSYLLGIHKVDWNKPVIVVEGLLDKLSFNNDDQVLALMSINLKIDVIQKLARNKVIYVLDNQFDHKDVTKQLDKIIETDFYVCAWDKTADGCKDVNDLRKNGWNDKKIKTMIFKNSYNSLIADVMIKKRIEETQENMYVKTK